MLIQLLIVVAIIGLLIVRPTFESVLVTIAFYGGIFVGFAFMFWYSARLSGGLADILLGGGGKRSKAEELVDLAEQRERERDFQAAIDLCEQAIAKEKRNPAPRLKLAELYLRLHKYDLYLTHMKNMLQACPGIPMSDRCTHMNRMADICIQHLNSRKAAIEILSHIIKEFPHTKYALYANERITGLR